MKKLFFSFLIVLITCANFIACKKALEPEVFSQLTSANFPKTQNDANAILTGFYANFSHDWGGLYCAINTGQEDNSGPRPGSWRYMSTTVTDEVFDNWNANGMGNQFNWGSNSYWGLSKLLPVVARSTAFIESLKTSPLPDALKKSATAETKCLRAWMMFLMYDFYGPINARVDPATLADTTYTARPTKEQYLGWMIKDLTEAIPDLMTRTNGTSSWGKVNKGLASMLLMKIYMNDKQWTNAKTVAESITTMGYSLLPSYKQVFIDEGNSEVIWASPSGINVPSHHMPCSTPGDIASMLGQQVDVGWGGQFIPWAFVEKYQTQDTRLETIAQQYTNNNGRIIRRGPNGLANGAIAFKNVIPISKSKVGDFSTVAFRYADVLLSLAEIENELNGPTATAVAFAKQISDRAASTLNLPAITASKEAFRVFLSDERGRELYWEGWRRQDMIRMGTWLPWGESLGFNPKSTQTLFPIRPSIVLESRGIVKQNPGYTN